MTGRLSGNVVLVEDPREANKIYNRGYFGKPQSGGGLELDLTEALLLLEGCKLKVADSGCELSFDALLGIADSAFLDFEIKYLAYRDLRSRGYVVRMAEDGFDFDVYARGDAPHTGGPAHKALAFSERSPLKISDIANHALRLKEGQSLVLAIVDEESDITYYENVKEELSGTFAPSLPGNVCATLLKDRVLVADEGAVLALHRATYGQKVGDRLMLSLVETADLMKRGLLEVVKDGAAMGQDEFENYAELIQSDLRNRLKVYGDLRSTGLIVKTGFKFGTHFRVYRKSMEKEHAPFLIHAMPNDGDTTWPEVSRGIRLAHSVKKNMVFALVGEKMTYFALGRMRP